MSDGFNRVKIQPILLNLLAHLLNLCDSLVIHCIQVNVCILSISWISFDVLKLMWKISV